MIYLINFMFAAILVHMGYGTDTIEFWLAALVYAMAYFTGKIEG